MSLEGKLGDFESEIEQMEEKISTGFSDIEEMKNSPKKPISYLIPLNLIFFLLGIFLVYKYLAYIFEFINLGKMIILKQTDNYIIIWFANLSLSIIVFIYIFTILFIGFFGSKTTLKKWLKNETMWVLIIFTIVVSGALIMGNLNNYSPSENVNRIKTNVDTTTKSLWETITCSFSPACIKREMESNQAEQTSNTEYRIRFRNSQQSTYALSDLKYPMDLDYQIKSSGGLKILKIDCYLNNRDEGNKPFYTEEINEEINTDEGLAPVNFKCGNLDKIPLSEDSEETDVTIIPVLTIELNTDYDQRIPVVDYNLFIKNQNLDIDREYSYIYLNNRINKNLSLDKSFKETNKALIVDNSGLKNNLPLLIGDGIEREFSFSLIIKKNPQNNIGRFISGEMTKLELPTFLQNNRPEIDYSSKLDLEDEKYIQRIYLKENEIDTNGKLLNSESMKFSIKSIFENENRFKITIINDNFVEKKDESNNDLITQNENSENTNENIYNNEKSEIKKEDEENNNGVDEESNNDGGDIPIP